MYLSDIRQITNTDLQDVHNDGLYIQGWISQLSHGVLNDMVYQHTMVVHVNYVI